MKIDTDINVDGIILDDVKHDITINLEEHLTYPFADEL